MNAAQAVVRIERTIPASPHQVYRAWLDPDTVAKWLTPGGIEVSRVEVDERVGGTYNVWQTNAGADVGGFECELLELVPDKKIVFRWGFVGPERRGGPERPPRLGTRPEQPRRRRRGVAPNRHP